MSRRATQSSFRAFSLDPTLPEPLHRQLYDELRKAILNGRLASGSRLPASRELASVTRVSRNTVLSAFEQLHAEGYIHSRAGSGTYVCDVVPDAMTPEPVGPPALPARVGPPRGIARRGHVVRSTELSRVHLPPLASAFRPGLPALDQFPMDVLRRIADRRFRLASARLMAYGDPQGYLPLREAVAAHLSASRGVRCDPSNVIIVNGAQQGVAMCAHLLADEGDQVWMEDPGYFAARAAFAAARATLVPVPVDDEGMVVSVGEARAPAARLVYCTPSHQQPLGVTMSLARRMALLKWAEGANAWIIEDDNASEFRYHGRPLGALQGIDENDRVIYIGSFSKVMFSSVRLGYVVAPGDLVDAFVRYHDLHERGCGMLSQAILSDFMTEGHFVRHLRRMRTLYATRLASLERAIQEHARDVLDPQAFHGGLNRLVWLPEGLDDAEVARRLAAAGVLSIPVSAYRLTPGGRGGLVLGFAGVDPAQIATGIDTIGRIVRGMLPGDRAR
jgi:GntR family transcriptional regulator/MocR family aminotransferase